MNKDEIIVSIVCEHEETQDIIIVKNRTKDEISKALKDFNDKYDSGEIECSWDEYFKSIGIEYVDATFNVDLTLHI